MTDATFVPSLHVLTNWKDWDTYSKIPHLDRHTEHRHPHPPPRPGLGAWIITEPHRMPSPMALHIVLLRWTYMRGEATYGSGRTTRQPDNLGLVLMDRYASLSHVISEHNTRGCLVQSRIQVRKDLRKKQRTGSVVQLYRYAQFSLSVSVALARPYAPIR
jgi:hypothetical protein